MPRDIRQADAERRREESRQRRLVIIPDCADPARRTALESDDIAWLMHYFGPDSGSESPFTYEFTEQQRTMIDLIRSAIFDGGDQSMAASRGEGKTTIAERLIIKYTLQGAIGFSVLFAATGGAAEDSLQSIKAEIENNDRLHEDYPEVCVPIRALESTPNRAHYQIASGNRHDNGQPYEAASTKFSWCGQEVFLPNVPGSPAAGAIIATRGLDSAVRGLKKKGRRVAVAVIDDPDTEDTARSEEQAGKLEKRIDRAIAGLGGQKRRVARVMLTTLQSRISASYRFTDAELKPSWHPKRFRFLVVPPERMDLWTEYVSLRHADWQTGTNLAHEFYVANRDAMESGAVVANPNRYGQGQLSALQFYFDEVARIGPEAVATEYDNDPPAESGPVESGINAHRVARQVSGFARYAVPHGCTVLTQGIDVGKGALHWVVRAWKPDGTGYTIDYAVYDVHGTHYGSDEGLDVAIRRAILGRLEQAKETHYEDEAGELRSVDLTLVDSGYRQLAVFAACAEAGLGVRPVKGCGKSNGCAQVHYPNYRSKTDTSRPGGDGWCEGRDGRGKAWLILANVDHWKAWEHDRWMTDPAQPGAMLLFGEPGIGSRDSDDQKWHFKYAHHIDAEKEVEEIVKGVLKRYWRKTTGRGQNHWLDASVYADVAANMLGVRLAVLGQPKAQRLPPKQRPTAAQLAGRR